MATEMSTIGKVEAAVMEMIAGRVAVAIVDEAVAVAVVVVARVAVVADMEVEEVVEEVVAVVAVEGVTEPTRESQVTEAVTATREAVIKPTAVVVDVVISSDACANGLTDLLDTIGSMSVHHTERSSVSTV